MVRKLLKHELIALFRVLVFFMIAVVVFALLGRVLLWYLVSRDGEVTTTVYLLTMFVMMFYMVAIYALTIAAYVLGCVRFYKTLFKGEGYMTLSLPATAAQIIWSKLLSSLIAVVAASVVSALSVFVFSVGWDDFAIMQDLFELFAALDFSYLFGSLDFSGWMYIVEAIILGIAAFPMSLLVVYAVISVGQTFTSHRVLATFALLVGVYFVSNMIVTITLIPLLTLAAEVSPHIMIWAYIVAVIGIDVGSFFLIRYMLTHKVNLIA